MADLNLSKAKHDIEHSDCNVDNILSFIRHEIKSLNPVVKKFKLDVREIHRRVSVLETKCNYLDTERLHCTYQDAHLAISGSLSID